MCSRDEIKAITSPSRSLEFRTAGFPQYGFKASLSDATCRPTAEINSVEVDAVVTDGQGRFVRGLTKDDFEILEDRSAQKISTFSLIDIPIERVAKPLVAANAIEPDVQSNRRPLERQRDWAEALQHHEAARQIDGTYQTAYVAASHVQVMLGHDEAARELALAAVTRRVSVQNPWWTYRLSGMDKALLRWLREEAERP